MNNLEMIKISEIRDTFRNLNEDIDKIFENISKYYSSYISKLYMGYAVIDDKIYFSKNWGRSEYKKNSLKIKKEDNLLRNKLSENLEIKNQIKTLDKIMELSKQFDIYDLSNKKTKKINNFLAWDKRIVFSKLEISYFGNHRCIFNPYYLVDFPEKQEFLKIRNIEKYQEFKDFIYNMDLDTKINPLVNTDFIFDENKEVLLCYKYRTLEDYDLSKVSFRDSNISGLNISKNKNLRINFDYLVKDLTDSNISGYDLKKYKFIGWNLSNADLRNTGATIDLASCIITEEGKMQAGTKFDEDNTFMFGSNFVSLEQAENLGVKIYRKER